MTTDQILAFTVIAGMMVAFIWDRFRYDVVACSALLVAVALGVVPFDKAFSGFSDDIVIIVGSALVVSSAVARSGIVDMTIKKYFPEMHSKSLQLAFLMIVVAIMSAFIKNIGALAIMMPVAFQFARKSGSPVSYYLMPMAFAALLGGLMTQIGTSPNIVVSRLREEMTGESFSMFDFTPVGAGLTVIGIIFLTFGYRLLPVRNREKASVEDILDQSAYTAEATLPADNSFADKPLRELLKQADGDVIASTILRGPRRISPFPDVTLKAGDTVLLEGSPEGLDFTNLYFYTVTWHALHTSMLMARERGQRFAGFSRSRYASGEYFQQYLQGDWQPKTAKVRELFARAGIALPDRHMWQQLREDVMRYGIYNRNLQAVPPTGSISYINHATSSIHPIVSKIEIRKEGKTGRVYYPAPFMTNDNLELYQDAYEIGPQKIIDTYAEATRHVDQGLSLTLFFPDTATTRDINRAQIYAWKKGIKTLYYIRLRQLALEGTEIEGCVSCAL